MWWTSGWAIRTAPRPSRWSSKLVEAARNPRNHRYSMSRGIPQLRVEIVKRYSANYGVELDPETEAIVTIGAKDALAHLLFAVIGPGDAVVSPNPAYPIHQYGVIMAEGPRVHAAHARRRPTFLNRLEHLYHTSSRKPRMILISFPHNPTTQCVDLEFFREIVAPGGAARHHGWCTISLTPISASTATSRPASCRWRAPRKSRSRFISLSKSFNMAGWRVGFCLGNPKMIGALARIKSYLDYGVFQPIQIASIIALRECEEDTEKICAIYQKRRDVLITGLDRAGWPVEPPQGTMFVWAPMPEQYQRRVARVLEAAAGESAGGGVAGHRIRPAGRRLRALRADREPAPDAPGYEGDPAVPEEVSACGRDARMHAYVP